MRIALTGGIGAGKSHVGQLLLSRNIKIYDCDEAAKRLMSQSTELAAALTQLIGQQAYDFEGRPCRKVIAQYLLASEKNKQAINSIVHPAVAADFERSGLEWLESAILFDSQFNKRIHFDRIVCVSAPFELRIQRIIKRDGISREKAVEWITSQMTQEAMERLSDYVIYNDGVIPLDTQIEHCIQLINGHDNQSASHADNRRGNDSAYKNIKKIMKNGNNIINRGEDRSL